MNSLTLAAVLIFITGGVNAQLLEPLNQAVLQNTDASFNCTEQAPGWTTMTWTVNGLLALSISENGGLIGSSAGYSARNHTTAGNYKWEFVMMKVTAISAGQVGCQVQGKLMVTATLKVQQNGTVAITGSNRTATEGDQVTFQCFAVGWIPESQLTWAFNGTPVDKGHYNTNSVANGTLMNSNSTLTFTAKENVSVECLASISTLPSPQISTVFLKVQKAVPTRNQTVLIATTVAFSLAALLALLFILIIFCCKRRDKKKSRYEEEVRARSLANRQAYAESGRVRENFGYVDDSPSVDNRDGVYAISGLRRSNYPRNTQLPQVSSNQYLDGSSYDGYSLDYPAPPKHRHLTHV